MKLLASALFLAIMPACGGCGTVSGMLAPKACLERYQPWGRPLDLDTSTRVYIGTRLDFAIMRHAPLMNDPVGVSLFSIFWAADMLLSSMADTLLFKITGGEYPRSIPEKGFVPEVASR
jgi:hypothetical protein